jgi:heme exporter protein B
MTAAEFWRQALEIMRKDLKVEGRAGEVLSITVPFGAAALLLLPLAIGTEKTMLSRIGPGMFFAVTLLFGMLVAFRQSATEGPAHRELLALLGIDPAATFVGRTIASTLLLLGFELVLVPLDIVLYNPEPVQQWIWLVPILLLVALGLSLVGTLAGAVTAGLRTRSTLASLIVAPLSVPLLIASTQVIEALRLDRSILNWIVLLIAMNLGLAVVGVLTARPLEETSR